MNHRRKVYLTENQLQLLMENKAGKNINLARKYLMNELGWDYDKCENLFKTVAHDVPSMFNTKNYFMLGFCRLFANKQITNQEDIKDINTIIEYANKLNGNTIQYDNNFNGLNFKEIKEIFLPMISYDIEANKKKLYGKSFDKNSDYKIIQVSDFKIASEYGKYVTWCITHSKDAYDTYTHNGFGIFYFMLKNGFENVQEKIGHNTPLDEYGLSMIAVSVNEDGNLNTCTCRWNHENGGNDTILDVNMISQLAGGNFYDIFKPISEEEIQRLKQPFIDAQIRLNNGENPKDIFDNVYTSREKGISEVVLNKRFNFLSDDNKLLSDIWFDYVDGFHNGVAIVEISHKFNYLNKNGKLLLDNMSDSVYPFNEYGYGKIINNNNILFVNMNGNKFDLKHISTIPNYVKLINGKIYDNYANNMNVIGIILDNTIDDDSYFASDNFVYTIADKNNKIIVNKIFSDISLLSGSIPRLSHYIQVFSFNKNYINFIDKNGEFLFDEDENITNEYYHITDNNINYKYNNDADIIDNQINNAYYIMKNKNNKILFCNPVLWKKTILFDNYALLNNTISYVELDNKYNLLDVKKLKCIFTEWFDYIKKSSFKDFFIIRQNNLYNLIDINQNLLFKNQWINNIQNTNDELVKINVNGMTYYMDDDLNLYDKNNNYIDNYNNKFNIQESKNKPQVEQDKYEIGNEINGDVNSYAHVVSENDESEVESSEVKLDSFKKQPSLNKKIWPNNKLNSKVRLRLLDISDKFWDSLNITWYHPKDAIITGSICNYNWSKFSDIDLHIIVDFSKVDKRTEFVKEFFDSEKNNFNSQHQDLKIFGFPIELYVQDISEVNISTGMYSLYKNKWIKEPDSKNIKEIGLNKYEIKEKSAYFMTCIDELKDEFNSTDDDAKLRKILRKAQSLKLRIKRMRKNDLEKNGEMSIGNIVFKTLRRTEYMGDLLHLIVSINDKLDSI